MNRNLHLQFVVFLLSVWYNEEKIKRRQLKWKI